MKKLVLILIIALAVAAVPNSVGAVNHNDKNIYISAVKTQDNDEFIILRNPGQNIEISALIIEFYNSSNKLSEEIKLSDGTFLPGGSILIGNNTARKTDVSFTKNLLPLDGRIRIIMNDDISVENCWGKINCQNRTTGLKSDEYLVSKCDLDDGASQECNSLVRTLTDPTIVFGGWKVNNPDPDPGTVPTDPTNPGGSENPPKPTLNSDCNNLTISEIGANLSNQFIEISNLTDKSLNISGCLLVTNRSAKQFVMPDLILESQSTYLVNISESNLTLSKTTNGQVYLLSSDGRDEIQSVAYPVTKFANSWALVDDEWRVLTNPSPGSINHLEPINLCDGLKLSEIGANLGQQFIELFNNSAYPINIKGCQLMTNRSNVKALSLPDEVIGVDGYKVINITDTELSLTKSTKGEVYLLSSDGEAEIDRIGYENLSKNTSFSLIDGQWLQTYLPTPGEHNKYQEYPNCETGYYRNVETGRCNKIIEPYIQSSCRDGYYRNIETNRCRKIVSSDAALTPCKEGYIRNIETNRCRKITIESDDQKACSEGYERNPETNRCRKIISSAKGNFPVNPDIKTGGNSTWTIGAAILVAMTGSVIVYQYRMEIGRIFRRLIPSRSDA